MVGEILFHLARKIFSKEVSPVDGTKTTDPRNPYATALGELDGQKKNSGPKKVRKV